MKASATGFLAWTVFATGAAGRAVGDADAQAVTVGMEGRVEVTVTGPRLESAPADRKAPVLLRIAAASPVSKGRTWYDLRYVGAVPGTFDLAKGLRRVDGAPEPPLPPILVKVNGLLPADHNGHLSSVRYSRLPLLAGYRFALVALSVLWAAGLVAFCWRKRPRRVHVAQGPAAAPPTIAERMAPLLERAGTTPLAPGERAQLERLIVAYWQEETGIAGAPLPQTLQQLRDHPEAGPALAQLEKWLHLPPGTSRDDPESALAFYRRRAGPTAEGSA